MLYFNHSKRHSSPKCRRRWIFSFLTSGLLFGMTGCHDIDPTKELDQAVYDYLEDQETADAGSAAALLNSIEAEREASVEASIAESESIRQSEEAESLSIEASEYAAYIESSKAESYAAEESSVAESVKESLASGGAPSGTLQPGKVSTLMESEIPKLRALYSDTIIIGNSRAKSVLDSGILTENEVLYKWASTVDKIQDITTQAASLYRGKTLFMMGVNDVGYYMGNMEGFKRDYIALIDLYRSINPNSDIYIQEIIPISDDYAHRWYNRFRIPEYNQLLREICAEKDCTLVSSLVYALPQFLADESGAHYNRQYHIYWAQTMANQMGLWEGR